jgi:hypothetical protein
MRPSSWFTPAVTGHREVSGCHGCHTSHAVTHWQPESEWLKRPWPRSRFELRVLLYVAQEESVDFIFGLIPKGLVYMFVREGNIDTA